MQYVAVAAWLNMQEKERDGQKPDNFSFSYF